MPNPNDLPTQQESLAPNVRNSLLDQPTYVKATFSPNENSFLWPVVFS